MILGGIEIPHDKGCLGHSDGDCLLHAVIDALLGACAMGDIGTHFPDNDPAFKGIDSRVLLERVLAQLPEHTIQNLDITLFLNRPKMKGHREALVDSLAGLMDLPSNAINLKAKTWEGMGVDDVISASVTLLLLLDRPLS